ncbi:MAG: DNA primase [Candidatus Aenigmatarchaeota archaeon]|nr:MAG: DNA primase [Candidatus Aenigmarchaeota archaeon]
MGKLAQSTSKYTIHAKFEANGVVEKPDVVGAIFGQTEGLLGAEMDLRELQRTGRIGRIEVEVKTHNGKSTGTIKIPSSLDASETALIAATLETIQRVGPCEAEIEVEKVEDIRASKRRYLVDRAKEILTNLFEEGMPESQQISEQIKEAVRSSEITSYKGLPAGPGLKNYDSIIICEGRADVINLLKNGIKNVIAIEGTSVPNAIIELTKEKIATAFVDGDRGGQLILRELFQKGAEIDYVAQAPEGKEVEELSKKEIFKALRERIPSDQVLIEKEPPKKKERRITKKIDESKKEKFREMMKDLTGTRAAYLLDSELNVLGKVPVSEMFNAMKEVDAEYLLFDGTIDQKLINFSSIRGIKYIIGMEYKGRVDVPKGMVVLSESELND